MVIQRILSYLLFFFLLAVFFLYWRNVDLPCEKPLLYSVGTVDSRFGISEKNFLSDIEAAAKIWDSAENKDLFAYSEGAPFKVNLVFDERQLQTIDAKNLQDSLDQTKATQQKLTEQQNTTLTAYRKAAALYQDMLDTFKKQLSSYNKEVEKWNSQGGAPADEYDRLKETAKSLEKLQQQLEEKRQKVNSLAAQVNAFSTQKVSLVNEYNSKVKQYVNRYGEPKEFDQGEYMGTEINIYQFDDRDHLRAVLVHELGHALGLLHGADPLSIMYPLMEKQEINPIVLSSEDKEMLATECSQNIWDVIFMRLENLKTRVQSI